MHQQYGAVSRTFEGHNISSSQESVGASGGTHYAVCSRPTYSEMASSRSVTGAGQFQYRPIKVDTSRPPGPIQNVSLPAPLPTPPGSATVPNVFAMSDLGTALQISPPPRMPNCYGSLGPGFPRTPGSKSRSASISSRMVCPMPPEHFQPVPSLLMLNGGVTLAAQQFSPVIRSAPAAPVGTPFILPGFRQPLFQETTQAMTPRLSLSSPYEIPATMQTPFPLYDLPSSNRVTRPIMGQPIDVQQTSLLSKGVALAVTNLDYNITNNEWKKILYQTFNAHVQVLNINVHSQQDGTSMAVVHVYTPEDARYAISQCHKQKIGYKRIQVSMHTPESPNSAQRVRQEVACILNEVSGHSLPLFKLIELYEKRFYRNISVSDLYHMKDTVEIKESSGTGNGRMVCLQSSLPTPAYYDNSSSSSLENFGPFSFYTPYCVTHCTPADYMLIEESGMLPYVNIPLCVFQYHVLDLIQTHQGELYLTSFLKCYNAAYEDIESTAQEGVPLEHLVSAVNGVLIKRDNLGVKKVVWLEDRVNNTLNTTFSEVGSTCINDSMAGRSSHPLNQQLSQFSREVVDLLKRMPGCQMTFSKFIPSYHHHFGRQCRVADFGFTKLLELFEAIPHVLQILGAGNHRILYLTHRIHLRRFTADLCRVLKAQPEKACLLHHFPELYKEVIGAEFNMRNFGVCNIRDMLIEISESQVAVEGQGAHSVLSIPKKNQTPEEIERTTQFGYEVINLLKNCPQCTMIFNKFIPSYHHHFGRQCRVSDYGFTKLLELFESIPTLVTIMESGEERYIVLTRVELLKILSEQMLNLLKNRSPQMICIRDLCSIYQKEYGHNLYIEEYGVTSVEELIEEIPHIAFVESRDGVDCIVLRNKSSTEALCRKCLDLLFVRCEGTAKLPHFMDTYRECFADSANLVEIKHSLSPAITIKEDDGTIGLHCLLTLAKHIMTILSTHQGKLTLALFEMSYHQLFNISSHCDTSSYPGVTVVLQIMDFLVSVRGRGTRQTILLRQDYVSRLAHQLVYKVGIYTELVKYGSLPLVDMDAVKLHVDLPPPQCPVPSQARRQLFPASTKPLTLHT